MSCLQQVKAFMNLANVLILEWIVSVCTAGNGCTDGVEPFLLLFNPCVSYAVMLDNMEITATIYISIYISYCDAISCMGGAPIQHMYWPFRVQCCSQSGLSISSCLTCALSKWTPRGHCHRVTLETLTPGQSGLQLADAFPQLVLPIMVHCGLLKFCIIPRFILV